MPNNGSTAYRGPHHTTLQNGLTIITSAYARIIIRSFPGFTVKFYKALVLTSFAILMK